MKAPESESGTDQEVLPGTLRPRAHRTKRELAYAAIREAIKEGRLAPGARLIIGRLARELGLSDVPVREALFQLQADGLVVNEPHVGATVARIEPADVLDVYQASAVLEGAAAGWAAPLLSEQDLAELDGHVAAMDTAVDAGDLESFAAHDLAFHRALYMRCPSRRLVKLIEDLWHTKERLRTAFPVRLRGAASQREHRAIMDAVRGREAERLERLVRAHLITAGRNRSNAIDQGSAATSR